MIIDTVVDYKTGITYMTSFSEGKTMKEIRIEEDESKMSFLSSRSYKLQSRSEISPHVHNKFPDIVVEI